MDKKQSKIDTLKKCIKKNLPPRYFQLLKTLQIKILRMIKRDVDYFYDKDFAITSLRNKVWVENFCDLILKTFNPKSVVDFGCGTGDLLSPFEKKGIEILGVDGSSANRNYCKINEDNFLLFDIRDKYKSKKSMICAFV